MLSQIAQRDPVERVVGKNRRGRLRREHLRPVAGGHDSRRPMHTEPVVTAVFGDVRLAGVHPHPHAQLGADGPLVRGKRALRGRRGRGCVARAGEDVEAGVPLGVHLLAPVRSERLAQQPTVLGEDRAVAVAQLLQQVRGTLDVAEEERHGAGRELGHAIHGAALRKRRPPDSISRRT